MKFLIASLFLLISSKIIADPPSYSGNWEWNNNVKIDAVYVHKGNTPSFIQFDNGQVCYINQTDNQLFSTVLSIRAQNTSADFLCSKNPDATFATNNDSRSLHRVKY